MHGFEFVSAQSAEDACAVLAADGGATNIVAGGTDLLGEIKQGTILPEILVSLQGIEGLRGVRLYEDGTLIGAMTTLADICDNSEIGMQYPALTQACETVATPQIRNVGTIGGNLCQRPRCWYFRSPHFDCRKKGGSQCFAFEGLNKFHAIFGGENCPAVHPSDTAVALTALNARILLISLDGARMLSIEDFFVSPDADATVENVLRPGEIVAQVVIPSRSRGGRSVFLKAKERQAMDFALASVGLSVDVDGDLITDARVVLGGVAPTPHRVREAEEAIAGKRIEDIECAEVGRIAVEGASPLSDNAYKVRLGSGLVSRAVRVLLQDQPIQGA